MMGNRPELYKSSVWCARCEREVETLATTGMHSGTRGLGADGKLYSDGVVMARAECHGDYADLAIGFSQLEEHNALGAKIILFAKNEEIENTGEIKVLTEAVTPDEVPAPQG